MFDLPNVASRLFGTPLMVGRAKLDVILSVLAPRFGGGALEPGDSDAESCPETEITADGIAIVSIVGTLVARSGYLDAASGLISYADIGAAIEAAIDDPSVRGVILDIDSCGGEVGGLFDLVDQINALLDATNKPVWAIANESALSAAYAIASAADRIYATRTAEVGSIGVVAAHIDESAADAKAGLSWTFLFAGDRKVDANAHAPLSEQARASIQADVDRLYEEFCALVAGNRGMSIEAVRGTQAAIYRGELAIAAGLADRIGTLDAAIADITAQLNSAAAPRPIISPFEKRRPSMATQTKEAEQDQSGPSEPARAANAPATEIRSAAPHTQTPAEIGWSAASTLSAAPTATREPESNIADRLRAEFAEIAAVAAQATKLGVAVDAADAMRKGVTAESLRRSVLEELAGRAEATSLVTVAPSSSANAESPIVRRVKERAAAARG